MVDDMNAMIKSFNLMIAVIKKNWDRNNDRNKEEHRNLII